MLCWLLEMILLVGRGLGRSEKTAPLWIKVWWAIDRSAMKIEGREKMRMVMMGPNLAWRFRRIGSNPEPSLRSHRIGPMMGTVRGPGGRGGAVGERRSRKALRRRAAERVRRTTNQISMF